MNIGKKQLTQYGKELLTEMLYNADMTYQNRTQGQFGEKQFRLSRGQKIRARKIWLRETHMAKVLAGAYMEVV